MTEYDAIVVGARVAGSSTAMLLARAGLRVLALDRATFPSDAISTHQVQLTGVATLRRWGILDRLEAAGTPPSRHVRFDTPYAVLDGHFPAFDGIDALYSPRRLLLDQILIEVAREAGAEIREGFTVDELAMDGGRVAGIRGRQGNGPAVTELAPIVIGADGKHSVVAKAAGAPVDREIEPLTVSAYTYWRDLPVAGGDLYFRPRRGVGLWPTNDGLTMSFIQWPIAEFDAFRTDIEGNLVRTLEDVGLGERVHAAERVERIRTTPDVPNVVRVPHGPGWALVGDAGLVMDPGTGQGIADAFRDAELVADAVVAGLGGARDLDEALAGYRRVRDDAVLPMWEFTTQLASFGPPKPEERVLFQALAANQAETDRFFGVITGAVPLREYMVPANLRRIVGMRGFAKIALGKMRAKRAA
jgi:2-polyprenyl-6-methoxyphenol hydroxylase-like FAD-dependent oxidoreductase